MSINYRESGLDLIMVKIGDSDVFYRVDEQGVRFELELDRLDGGEACESPPPEQFWNAAEGRPTTLTNKAVSAALSRKIEVQYQGDSVACVAFSLIAAMELCAYRKGMTWKLSEWYADWMIRAGRNASLKIPLEQGAKALAACGTCSRSLWNLRGEEPTSDVVAQANYRIREYALIERKAPQWICANGDSAEEEPMLDGAHISNTAYLECILQSGHDIVVAMPQGSPPFGSSLVEVTCWQPEFGPNGETKYFCLPMKPTSSHAMVIVGYDRDGETPSFILRDSAQNGEERHVRYSYDYVRKYAAYGIVILDVGEEFACVKPTADHSASSTWLNLAAQD